MFAKDGLMQGWKSEWGGRVGGIPSIELKNLRFPFHVFCKILIAYSRFSRSDKTDLKDFGARDFSKTFDCGYSEISPNHIF